MSAFVTVSEEGGRQLRFSAARFAAQRKKVGLSAAKYAKLLGVSALSVYKWESGQTRPRRAQLEAIAGLRNLGKREAAVRLEHLEAAEAAKKPVAKKAGTKPALRKAA